MIEPAGIAQNLAGLFVTLPLHPSDARRAIIAAAAHHNQLRGWMLAGEAPNILRPGVTVDRGEVDAEVAAGGVAPLLAEQSAEIGLAVGIRDVAINDPIVDHVAA